MCGHKKLSRREPSIFSFWAYLTKAKAIYTTDPNTINPSCVYMTVALALTLTLILTLNPNPKAKPLPYIALTG